MRNNKRFYGTKLREDFINGDIANYILRLEEGYMIFTFFIKLLLRVAQSNIEGYLQSEVGAMLIDWTPKTISEELIFFTPDQVELCLDKLHLVGLIADCNGTLKIVDFERYIYSETADAERKREARKKAKELAEQKVEPENSETRAKERKIDKPKKESAKSVPQQIQQSSNTRSGYYYSDEIKEKYLNLCHSINDRFKAGQKNKKYIPSHEQFFRMMHEVARYPTVRINGYALDTGRYFDKVSKAYIVGDGGFLDSVIRYVEHAIGTEKVKHTLYYFLNSFYNAAVTGVVAA